MAKFLSAALLVVVILTTGLVLFGYSPDLLDTDNTSASVVASADCGDFWNPQISASTSNFDQTSPNSADPGRIIITVCLTTQSSSGSASIRYFEVPSSGAQILKYSNVISAPWTGCYNICCGGINFNVQDNSKIRLLVTSNSIQQVHQVNAG